MLGTYTAPSNEVGFVISPLAPAPFFHSILSISLPSISKNTSLLILIGNDSPEQILPSSPADELDSLTPSLMVIVTSSTPLTLHCPEPDEVILSVTDPSEISSGCNVYLTSASPISVIPVVVVVPSKLTLTQELELKRLDQPLISMTPPL